MGTSLAFPEFLLRGSFWDQANISRKLTVISKIDCVEGSYRRLSFVKNHMSCLWKEKLLSFQTGNRYVVVQSGNLGVGNWEAGWQREGSLVNLKNLMGAGVYPDSSAIPHI